MKKTNTNKKILKTMLSLGTIAAVATTPIILTSFTNTESVAKDSKVVGVQSVTNLTASQSATTRAIDLTWVNSDPVGVNTVYYFAVRDVLLQEEGWKIYSSLQTNLVTITSDTQATINDTNFITQGAQYEISMTIDLDVTESTDVLNYYNDDIWTGWNEGTTSTTPQPGIGITQFVSSFATPLVSPSAMTFAYYSTSSQTLTYSFTFNNGSLEFYPKISAQISTNGGPFTDVPYADVNVVFNEKTFNGYVEVLRLTPETSYDIIFAYDYQVQAPQFSQQFTNMTTIAPSTITIASSVSGSVMTLDIGGSGITNVIGATNADVIITNRSDVSVRLSTLSVGNVFIDTHTIDISALGAYDELEINIIAYDDSLTPIALNGDNIFIQDGIISQYVDVEYNINSNDADDSLIGLPYEVIPVKGTKNGELNIHWEIDLPDGIKSLSQLGFTFEISTVSPWQGAIQPTDWIEVTNQTTSIDNNMDWAIVTGLDGSSYRGDVWARVTIDYLDVDGYVPVTSVPSLLAATPKQPNEINNNDDLSTEDLVWIIVGSVAGVILIGLGIWLISKKKKNKKNLDSEQTPSPTPNLPNPPNPPNPPTPKNVDEPSNTIEIHIDDNPKTF